MDRNIILASDSYKYSHYLQYPPETRQLYAYVESRGGMYPRTVFFGLQGYLKRYLTRPFTLQDIDEAEAVINTHIPGLAFNRRGWEHILDVHGGYLPVRVRAVREGEVVPVGNVLVTVESLDENVPWIVGHLETTLLRGIWYPTTVATRSWHIKQVLKDYLKLTSDLASADDKLLWMLHDFGMRGASSGESAGISGAAHLVNFLGTDNMDALGWVREFYAEPMAGFSIPASEHSTMTIYGRDNEVAAYRNMIRRFGKPGAVFANVGDSYDIYNVCRRILPQVKDELIASGATMVLRPDSGQPEVVVPKVISLLAETFGSRENSKGYRVLADCVRVIQGDGINERTIPAILQAVMANGFSAENFVMGCGGYLLQDLTRDTLKFAMKTSAALLGDEWVAVQKDPVTDPGKRSKAGRVTLYRDSHGGFSSGLVGAQDGREALETVYETGKLLREWSFAEIRQTAGFRDY